MISLYTEEQLQALKAQIRRRLLLVGLLFLLFLALFIITLILDDHKQNRPELWTTLIVILGGGAMIFCYDLLLRPLLSYRRHMEAALHGRCHETKVVYDHQNSEISVIESVPYQDLIFLGEADKHGDREQMFYWDTEFPSPPFVPGQEVTLRYFDRFIIAYQI